MTMLKIRQKDENKILRNRKDLKIDIFYSDDCLDDWLMVFYNKKKDDDYILFQIYFDKYDSYDEYREDLGELFFGNVDFWDAEEKLIYKTATEEHPFNRKVKRHYYNFISFIEDKYKKKYLQNKK